MIPPTPASSSQPDAHAVPLLASPLGASPAPPPPVDGIAAPGGTSKLSPKRRLIHHGRSASAASYLGAAAPGQEHNTGSASSSVAMPSATSTSMSLQSSEASLSLTSDQPPPYASDALADGRQHESHAVATTYTPKDKPSSPLGAVADSSISTSFGMPSPRTLRAIVGSSRTVHINIHNYFANGATKSSAAPAVSSSSGLSRSSSFTALPPPASLANTASAGSWFARLAKSTQSLHLIFMCLAWYAASALTNNAKKQILIQFPFPVSLTIAQFLSVAVLCLLGSSRNWLSLRPLDWTIVRTLLPLGIFQIGGHTFASLAMARVPVAFVHTVKALSPLFTVLVSHALLGARYPAKVWLSLLPLMAGVILACTFGKASMAFHITGFLFSALSTIIFVLQSILSKKILSGGGDAKAVPLSSTNLGSAGAAKYDPLLPTSMPRGAGPQMAKLDKINIMYYSSLMAFATMIPLWLTSDVPTLMHPHGPEIVVDRRLLGLFLLNGLAHFSQALLAFSILSRVSTVTYSIVSLLKRIVVIVAAIAWFGDTVSGTQACGVALTFVGLWLYQRAKRTSGSSGRAGHAE